ncbi:MAG: hypothetical protein KDC54_24485, partial [Lewinella sp.]|nr:hypothetical protein [Lewinella sp.]
MRRKSWFLTFLLATGLALPTCEILGPPCDCPRPLGEFFDIQEVTVNQRATIGCCVLVVEEGATIPFSDYQGMEIKYGVEYIAQSRPAPRVRGLSLMGSLLACDCVENGWQGAKTESLANLTVTTLHDFSDIYLAGDTINDLLTVLDMGQPVALPAYLSRPATLIQEESLWLNLTEAPASGEDFQAEVTVTLSNG